MCYTRLLNYLSCIIDKKKYFQLGASTLQIEPLSESSDIKVILHVSKEEKVAYVFRKEESPVTIGRKSSCGIRIDSTLLSKEHCHLNYTNENKWELKDGYNDRSSTNGTWLLIKKEFEITEETTYFKIGQDIIKATLN